MREVLSIATMLLLLAFAGLEPSHAQVTKVCKSDALSTLLSDVC